MPTADAPLTLPLTRLRASDLPLVGGKGANLGELTHAGFAVPPGFCLTTTAFRHFTAAVEGTGSLYARLEQLDENDLDGVRRLGQALRERLQAAPMPPGIARAVLDAWTRLGPEHAYAVRSSATAEDLPDLSFAGQQDSFLNVRGEAALLAAVQACWVSLYTDRAMLYRAQHGLGHQGVALAVVVQRLVPSEISGILFTADPVTGRRSVSRIDASFGLGEALVAGLVSADTYSVDRRVRRVTGRQVSDKALATEPAVSGGIQRTPLTGADRTRSALSDAQVLAISDLGARIEAHYGVPQDIEWALADGQLLVLQARPITTLYPLPDPRSPDAFPHVYLSFGHLQMMTDAMPPLALSVLRTVIPAGRDGASLESTLAVVAGGRLYLDVSYVLRHPVFRRVLPRFVGSIGDALIGDALADLAARPGFGRGPRLGLRDIASGPLPAIVRGALARLMLARPERSALTARRFVEDQVRLAEHRVASAPGLGARLDAATAVLTQVFLGVFRRLFPGVFVGVLAQRALGVWGRAWATQADLAALTRGLEGNVASEMDLALADLADAARPSPALSAQLKRADLASAERLQVLDQPGGAAFLARWHAFLDRYGARGPAEIDLSRPRWHEDPTSLLNMLAGQLSGGQAGTHRAHLNRLREEARAAQARVVSAAGPWRAPLVRRLTRVARGNLALREHPKFLLVQVLDLVKSVVLEAAVTLLARGQLDRVGDVWFLTLPELRGALARPERGLHIQVAERRQRFGREVRLRPPRVMTGDGEVLNGRHRTALAPAAALIGQPVSSGVVEGQVRVMLSPNDAGLQSGEILVAPYTDPGWTPLFIRAAGLITEVGGLMTHGSVVAREYGLPAVVGVLDATTRLHTGQRVRVNGDLGSVEVLEDAASEGSDRPA